MKKEELNLVTLTIIEEDLSEAQLELILDHIEEIVKVIREVDDSIGELEEEME